MRDQTERMRAMEDLIASEFFAEMTAMKMNKITNSQHDVNLNYQYLNLYVNRIASDYYG